MLVRECWYMGGVCGIGVCVWCGVVLVWCGVVGCGGVWGGFECLGTWYCLAGGGDDRGGGGLERKKRVVEELGELKKSAEWGVGTERWKRQTRAPGSPQLSQ